jgi:hypothetical protein
MMALQTCQEYAQKSASTTLTEYEVQLYEWICRTTSTYLKGHDFMLRKQMAELERDALQAEAEHREWMKAQDKIDGEETES